MSYFTVVQYYSFLLPYSTSIALFLVVLTADYIFFNRQITRSLWDVVPIIRALLITVVCNIIIDGCVNWYSGGVKTGFTYHSRQGKQTKGKDSDLKRDQESTDEDDERKSGYSDFSDESNSSNPSKDHQIKQRSYRSMAHPRSSGVGEIHAFEPMLSYWFFCNKKKKPGYFVLKLGSHIESNLRRVAQTLVESNEKDKQYIDMDHLANLGKFNWQTNFSIKFIVPDTEGDYTFSVVREGEKNWYQFWDANNIIKVTERVWEAACQEFDPGSYNTIMPAINKRRSDALAQRMQKSSTVSHFVNKNKNNKQKSREPTQVHSNVIFTREPPVNLKKSKNNNNTTTTSSSPEQVDYEKWSKFFLSKGIDVQLNNKEDINIAMQYLRTVQEPARPKREPRKFEKLVDKKPTNDEQQTSDVLEFVPKDSKSERPKSSPKVEPVKKNTSETNLSIIISNKLYIDSIWSDLNLKPKLSVEPITDNVTVQGKFLPFTVYTNKGEAKSDPDLYSYCDNGYVSVINYDKETDPFAPLFPLFDTNDMRQFIHFMMIYFDASARSKLKPDDILFVRRVLLLGLSFIPMEDVKIIQQLYKTILSGKTNFSDIESVIDRLYSILSRCESKDHKFYKVLNILFDKSKKRVADIAKYTSDIKNSPLAKIKN